MENPNQKSDFSPFRNAPTAENQAFAAFRKYIYIKITNYNSFSLYKPHYPLSMGNKSCSAPFRGLLHKKPPALFCYAEQTFFVYVYIIDITFRTLSHNR